MEMLGGVSTGGLVATPHVSAGSAYPQVNPLLVDLETFLAAQSTRCYGCDPIEMRAFALHAAALLILNVPERGFEWLNDTSMFPIAVALIAGADRNADSRKPGLKETG
jgi:hypothetical protein